MHHASCIMHMSDMRSWQNRFSRRGWQQVAGTSDHIPDLVSQHCLAPAGPLTKLRQRLRPETATKAWLLRRCFLLPVPAARHPRRRYESWRHQRRRRCCQLVAAFRSCRCCWRVCREGHQPVLLQRCAASERVRITVDSIVLPCKTALLSVTASQSCNGCWPDGPGCAGRHLSAGKTCPMHSCYWSFDSSKPCQSQQGSQAHQLELLLARLRGQHCH